MKSEFLSEKIIVSLLIIRCPYQPFKDSDGARLEGLQSACIDQFEWYLLDGLTSDRVLDSGIGSTDSIPYADEALVVMPSIDVRFIQAKVPLVNAKKLQQILPNLIEDAVLSGIDRIAAQVLPPLAGNLAMERTIALIDQAWLDWLSKQLTILLAPRVRLIAQCMLLPLAQSGENALGYQVQDDQIFLTRRTANQEGIAWVQYRSLQDQGAIVLPEVLSDASLVELNGSWLVRSGQQYLQDNSHSKSPHYALNLLSASFRAQTGLASRQGMVNLLRSWRTRADVAGSQSASWTDPVVWRTPLRWAGYALATMALGFSSYLAWMRVDDWRWDRQMQILAGSYLQPLTLAKLGQAGAAAKSPSLVEAFVQQVLVQQRSQGHLVDADFAPMASKLQQLKMGFDPQSLQAVEYDGRSLVFEFKASAMIQREDVLARARTLGFAVQAIGLNRYRLWAFDGLGAKI